MARLNRKQILIIGLLLVCSGTLYGCGEELYELEPNEEEIIVNYAAHIISKYNTEQPEGYQYVYIEDESEETQEEENQSEENQSEENNSEENNSEENKSEEATEEATEEAAGTNTQDADNSQADASDTQTWETVSLSEALGLGKVRAIYTGAELTDSYGDTVVAENGKELLVLHIALQNPTEKKKSCDLLSVLPQFRVTVNGSVRSDAQLTILPDNLATWERALSAGAIEDTVILFQVQQGAITQVEQLSLEVTCGETTSQVVLL